MACEKDPCDQNLQKKNSNDDILFFMLSILESLVKQTSGYSH